MASAKRPRTPSRTQSGNISSPEAHAPLHKASRTSGSPGAGFRITKEDDDSTEHNPQGGHHPLLCTLPPTCNRKPTPILDSRDLETHYAKYHAHVCEEKGCGSVFPDERLLELHQTECHDPVAAVKKDRGEKIFACHLASCNRMFATPKGRRLHLISAHGYPKEYFFSVTNKGIGGLLKKWGDGASLIRKGWKAREGKDQDKDSDDERMEEGGQSEDEDDKTSDMAELANVSKASTGGTLQTNNPSTNTPGQGTDGVDSLANTLDSLSLVPSQVRFGRGGKVAGFAHNNQQRKMHGKEGQLGAGRGNRGGRGQQRGGLSGSHVQSMDVDAIRRSEQPQEAGEGQGHHGQGLGWAARGRAGVIPVVGGRGGRGGGRGNRGQ